MQRLQPSLGFTQPSSPHGSSLFISTHNRLTTHLRFLSSSSPTSFILQLLSPSCSSPSTNHLTTHLLFFITYARCPSSAFQPPHSSLPFIFPTHLGDVTPNSIPFPSSHIQSLTSASARRPHLTNTHKAHHHHHSFTSLQHLGDITSSPTLLEVKHINGTQLTSSPAPIVIACMLKLKLIQAIASSLCFLIPHLH